MTLGNSICSRYKTDERLTVDALSAVECPLELVSSKTKRKGASACTRQSLPQGSPSHRSIFSAYWKTDQRPSRSLSPISSEVEKLLHPQRRRIQKTFTYTYDRDPYQYFGIEEDEGKTSSTDDDDSDSLNSYEHDLHNNEVKVTRNSCRRSRLCPSLSYDEVGINRMAHGSAEKAVQSDTALFAKTSPSLQRLSCLRKNRFSLDTDNSNSNLAQSNRRKGKGEHRTSVTFEPKIQVVLYSPPMEKWAPNKWSEWFGG